MAALDEYFARYGHQVFNLDFAVPTQREDPTVVLSSLRAMIDCHGPSTHERRSSLIRERDQLVDQTCQKLGPLRRRVFKKLLKNLRIEVLSLRDL